jgi:hypothetical protein
LDELTVGQVLFDLERLLAMAAGTHALAVDGVRLERDQWEKAPVDPENPDPLIYFGIGDPNEPTHQKYAAWKRSNLPSMLSEDGFVIRQLGQQWAVFVFDEWEHWVRSRLATAHGVRKRQIKVDMFGDLRLIRNDIIHNGGTASANRSGKCLVLKWFVPGHPIAITAKHVAEFMERVSFEELGKPPS